MRACTRYAIAKKDEDSGTSVLTREAGSDRAAPTATIQLDGTYLESQFDTGHGETLLCLSDGSPYEAGLHMYLLADDNEIVDAIEGGAAYAAAIFKTRRVADATLDFEFFTNAVVYQIKLLPQAKFRFSLPTGWKYKHRLRAHRLTLEALSTGKQ